MKVLGVLFAVCLFTLVASVAVVTVVTAIEVVRDFVEELKEEK